MEDSKKIELCFDIGKGAIEILANDSKEVKALKTDFRNTVDIFISGTNNDIANQNILICAKYPDIYDFADRETSIPIPGSILRDLPKDLQKSSLREVIKALNKKIINDNIKDKAIKTLIKSGEIGLKYILSNND